MKEKRIRHYHKSRITSVKSNKPTDDPKDAQDVWGKDDQEIDDGKEEDSYSDVTWPPESFIWEEQLLDRPPYLREF